MSKIKLSSSILATIIAAGVLISAALVFIPKNVEGESDSLVFVVDEGDSANAVANKLNDAGIISKSKIFTAYAVLTNKDKDFKAGEYNLEGSNSIHKLVFLFSSDSAQTDDIEVTIPEGSTVADIDQIFAESGLTEPGVFLVPDILELEGYLFPDTYRFRPSVGRDDIVDRLQREFVSKVGNDISRDKVTIASMLEREVRTYEDMQIVAGIIKKRSEIGMALQIDATVAYGVCREKYENGRYCNPSLVNLVDNIPRDSAYNTYIRPGLPVGPIANPGLTALEAASNPIESEYLFYLSAKDGTTIFSETIEEHSAARRIHIL